MARKNPEAVGDALARLSAADGADRRSEVKGALGTVVRSARGAGVAALTGGRWLAETLHDVAPKLPVRDLDTLRAQHPGLGTEHLADQLIGSAVKAATAVGVAGGALAAVQWTAPPTLLTAPAQLAAETLAMAAIEIKLIAELHEVYGVPAAGNARERGLAYLSAWVDRKGVEPGRGALAALGSAVKRRLRRRVLGRFGRNITTLGPLLSGAVLAGAMNRHETKTLAARIQSDLRVAAATAGARQGR